MHAKISFKNDYSEGAHPKVLETLSATNDRQEAGYGQDGISQQARRLIHELIGQSQSAIFLYPVVRKQISWSSATSFAPISPL